MNKTELVAAVAEKAEISKAKAGEAVSAVFDIITDELVSGGKISMVGFGTFEVKEHAARTARNPRTGEMVDVPAKKTPAFKAGKGLKDAVAGK